MISCLRAGPGPTKFVAWWTRPFFSGQPRLSTYERFIFRIFILSSPFIYRSGYKKTNEKLLNDKTQIELSEFVQFLHSPADPKRLAIARSLLPPLAVQG